jgi:predicted GIY-YIG superfamily endonuclease
MTKSEALKLEYRIKRLPVDKKIFEITGKEKARIISKIGHEQSSADI